MKPLKAPSANGLHAIFYQSQWHIVGNSFGRFIKDVFNNCHIPEEIKKILLVLIPKNDNPLNLKMYWPISLCIVFYKTILRLLLIGLKIYFLI